MEIVVTNAERRPVHEFGQIEDEFSQLLEIAASCTSILEIGSRYGESGRRFAEAMPAGSKIVCVDLGYEPLSPEWRTLAPLLWRMGGVKDRDVTVILGNSSDETVVEEVRKRGPFGMVFIDAGHEYHQVSADWNNYRTMTKIVAFHDIVSNSGSMKFWQETKRQHANTAEFVKGASAGIGVVWIPE